MRRKHTRDQDGIYRRPDSPYWWAATPNGRGGSARRSTGIRTDADPHGTEARAVRAAWLAPPPPPIAPPPAPAPARPTFDDLLLAYLAEVTTTKRAPKRDHASARALYPRFTGRPLSDLTGADVRAHIAARQEAGIGPACINRELALMSAATNWARRALDWSIPNPWQGRRLQEPLGRTRHLSRDEATALLAAADARAARWPWLADFIRLCLATGLRPGEALALDWERTDLSRRLIQFRGPDQKSARAGAIPINDSARAVLIARAAYRARYCPASPWVFCRRDGARVNDIKKGFAACASAAGIPDLHPHDLRRTFGSWLVQAGIGIERVSRLLRHASVEVTARVYAHLRPSDLADAAAILDEPEHQLSRQPFTQPGSPGQKTKKPLESG